MSEMIRVLGRAATVAGARVLVVQRGDGLATLKWFPGPTGRSRALAEADLRTSVRVPGLAACRSLIDLDGGLALLLDGAVGPAVSVRTRGAPMPPRAALELVAAVGEVLLALEEHDTQGGMVLPEDVSVGPDGAIHLLDPGSGPRADDAADGRSLTWRLGGLLYAVATGRVYPMRAGMPFAREVSARRRLEALGVSAELSGLIRLLLIGAAQVRPWPEEAIMLARALTIVLDGPGLAEWSAGERPLLRDAMVGRLIPLEAQPHPALASAQEPRTQIEVLFEDVQTPDEDESTDLLETAPPAPAATMAEDHESSEDEDTPEDALRPHALLRALDEETQPFEAIDAIDDVGILEEPGPAANEAPSSRARFWSLLGLR